jgi:DNA-binding LacI/PurR family transcriptional regulator
MGSAIGLRGDFDGARLRARALNLHRPHGQLSEVAGPRNQLCRTQHRIAIDLETAHSTGQFDHARDIADQLDLQGTRLDAALAASDEIALGAMAAAFDLGLRVPKDIAFVSFGGVAWSAHTRPALTAAASDPNAIGEGVTEVFQALEDGGKSP